MSNKKSTTESILTEVRLMKSIEKQQANTR